MNHKLSLLCVVCCLALCVALLSFDLGTSQFQNRPSPHLTGNLATPTIAPTPNATPLFDGSDLTDSCGQISKTTSLEPNSYIDLGQAGLTTVDDSWFTDKGIKEVSLIRNSIPVAEQERITKLYPKIKFDFYPQKFDSSRQDSNWKEFESKAGAISFNYPFGLIAEDKSTYFPNYTTGEGEIITTISVHNSFADFPYYWRSCASAEGYLNLEIKWDKTESELTLDEYAKKYAEGDGQKIGKKYVIPKQVGMMRMLASIEDTAFGNFRGLYIVQGEARNEYFVTKLNNRFYTFTITVGGETGSEVGDFPMSLFKQIMSSVKEFQHTQQ